MLPMSHFLTLVPADGPRLARSCVEYLQHRIEWSHFAGVGLKDLEQLWEKRPFLFSEADSHPRFSLLRLHLVALV